MASQRLKDGLRRLHPAERPQADRRLPQAWQSLAQRGETANIVLAYHQDGAERERQGLRGTGRQLASQIGPSVAVAGAQELFELVEDHRNGVPDLLLQHRDKARQVLDRGDVHMQRGRAPHSLDQGSHGIVVLAHCQHQVAAVQQIRDQTCVDERSLADARRALQDDHWLLQDLAQQLPGLTAATKEHRFVGSLVGTQELVRCGFRRVQYIPVRSR